MPKLINQPTIIDCVGTKPKQIQEFAGRVNSGHAAGTPGAAGGGGGVLGV